MLPDVEIEWRGDFTSREVNELHAEAFGTRVFGDDEWDRVAQCRDHSFGWVVARSHERPRVLVGFLNVVSDGVVHAWLQDVMVAQHARGNGVGSHMVRCAVDRVRRAGHDWIHVDFDDGLAPFYLAACGFAASSAGLLELS